jgi:hypothetical protein
MSMRPDERYPLTWPAGWPRTPTWKRAHSPFKIESTDRAMRELMDELGRLGATRIIVSSNLKLRQDGMPYSQQPRTDDEGIAVYFVRKGVDMVLACDKFAKREANMRAITKTIDAIRGIERWGSSDMMERAFTGFTALPAGSESWWGVLGVEPTARRVEVEAAYRRLRSQHHPDKGGEPGEFDRVQRAYEQATVQVS